MADVTDGTPGTGVGLEGWDLVNAARFATVNEATAVSTPAPGPFESAPTGSAEAVAKGTWAPWRLVPGSAGQTVVMAFPIAAGSATYELRNALDPARNGPNVTLGDGNLSASRPGAGEGVPPHGNASARRGATSGKFYFELTNVRGMPNQQGAGRDDDLVFVGLTAQPDARSRIGKDGSGPAYGYSSSSEIAAIGQPSRMAAAWDDAGTVVGVAVDLDARKIWFRGSDGTWQADGADPATGGGADFDIDTSAPLYPSATLRPNAAVRFNFGPDGFAHDVPDGFTPGWVTEEELTLDGATLNARVRLADVPGEDGKRQVVTAPTGEDGAPAATLVSLDVPAGNAGTVPDAERDRAAEAAGEAMVGWLRDNLAKVAQVFHVLDLSDEAVTGEDLAWIRPTGFSYAAADVPTEGGESRSALGILTLTGGRNDTTGLSAQLPASLVAAIPDGADAVMAISAERITERMLRPAAERIFPGADPGVFVTAEDGKAITNDAAIDWVPLRIPDADTEENQTVVTPKVAKGGFRIAVDGRRILLSFDDVSFDYDGATLVGSETIRFSFEQSLYLVVRTDANGRRFLVPSYADPEDASAKDVPKVQNLVVTPVLDEEARSFERNMLIVGIALTVLTVGLVSFGAGGTVIAAGTDEASAAGNGAQAVADGGADAIEMGEIAVDAGAQAPGEYENVDEMLDAARMSIYGPGPAPPPSAVAGCLAAPAVRIGLFSVGALSAIGAASTLALHFVNSGNFDEDEFNDQLPDALTLESFVAGMLEPFEWPGTSGWTLHDVALDDSLLIFGTLEGASNGGNV